MPSNNSNFIKVASVLDNMGLHDHADEVMALATTERAAAAGLPYATAEDAAMLSELKEFRFAVKHLYTPQDGVESAYKDSVLFRLDRAIEARQSASNVRTAQTEPSQVAFDPFEVFARHGLGDLSKSLVRSEATKFAGKNKKKVADVEMPRVAKQNLDSFIRAAMTPENLRHMVNMALSHLKENGTPEEYAQAKTELASAAEAILAAASQGYEAAKQQFPMVTKVWPANFPLNTLQGAAPRHEHILQKDPRHREDMEDHLGDTEPADVAMSSPVEEAAAEEAPVATLTTHEVEPPDEVWPSIDEPQPAAKLDAPAPVEHPDEITERLVEEGIDDVAPIKVDDDGEQSAVADNAPAVEEATTMLVSFLEESHPGWRSEIQSAPSPMEYLNGALGADLSTSIANADAVANAILERAQTGSGLISDEEPLADVDHMQAPEGVDDAYGLYQHTREKFFRHPDKWPVTHSNKRGGLTVVPSHAYSLLASHMPALHSAIIATDDIAERHAIIDRSAAALLQAFEQYFGKLSALKADGKLGPRRTTDMAKLAPIIKKVEDEYAHWPQIVDKAKEYVSQPDLPEVAPRPDDNVPRSVSPVSPDLGVTPAAEQVAPSSSPTNQKKDIWEGRPSPLEHYEKENGLPPGTGGALVPPKSTASTPHLPAWREKMRKFVDSLKGGRRYLLPAAGAAALGFGIGMWGPQGPDMQHARPAPSVMTTQDVNEGLSDLSSRMPSSQVGVTDRAERLNPSRVAPPTHKPSPADWMEQYEYQNAK